MAKPILVLDFDGVLHSYESGWQGATTIADPPTPGMVPFLRKAVDHFDVHILSSRSKELGGVDAMRMWLKREVEEYYDCVSHSGSLRDFDDAQEIISSLKYPIAKPAAFLTIDDRAICFDGTWPKISDLVEFKPWYQRSASNGSIGAASPDASPIRRILMAVTSIFRMGRP